jgi:hypothetical protein
MRRFLPILAAALLGGALALNSTGAEEGELIPVTNLAFNTSADEDDPHVAEAGMGLYFTRAKKGKEELQIARRKGTAAWPKKTIPIDDYVQGKGETRSAFATQGKYPQFLYFAAKDEEGKNFDLFVAVKQDVGRVWTEPTPVHNVNTAEDECFPWIADGGKSLYFSRKTKEGWKLMVATRTNSTGPQGWQEPEAVDLPVGFHHATVTSDGKTMILQGPLEKDRWGLFLSTKSGKGWGKPEAIAGLNHPEGKTGDRSPNLSRDGYTLYFASDRPGGKGGLDIYSAKMANVRKKK